MKNSGSSKKVMNLISSKKNKAISKSPTWHTGGVQHESQELYPELKFDPIPGYMGTTRVVVSENIFGMTYKNSLRNADELVKQINQNKAEQLYKSSQSLGPFKKVI